MSLIDSRKYVGSRFGLSVSAPPKNDPDWPASYGPPEDLVNRFVLTEGTNFLFEGGRLILGHRWADGQGEWDHRGVLNHLLLKSRDFRSFRPALPDPATGAIAPAILNLLAWPDLPPPPTDEHASRLIGEGVLEIRQIRPRGFDAAFLDRAATSEEEAAAVLRTPLGQYARLRALTAMRRELVREADFRLCFGGPLGKPERRLPGIVEEALFTAEAKKPLYISGAFGGASKALADWLLQRRVKIDAESVFFTPPAMVQLMNDFASDYPVPEESERASVPSGWNAQAAFRAISLEDLASRAGLKVNQYIDLLAAPSVERAMAWIVNGMSNLRSQGVAQA